MLPYVHETSAGQQAGQEVSALGAISGQGGFVGDATLHTPLEHWASRVAHRPKSHVVPSGSRHWLPFAGWMVESGHAASTATPSAPPSRCVSDVGVSVPHATAIAEMAEPSTETAAIRMNTRARGGATKAPQ